MKRVSFFLALASLVVLSFGLASANIVTVSTGDAWGSAPEHLNPGQTANFVVNWDLTSGTIAGCSIGLRMFMASAPVTTTDVSAEIAGNFAPSNVDSVTYDGNLGGAGFGLDGGRFYGTFSFDGIDADTATIGGFALFAAGITAPANLDALGLSATPSDVGNYFCIDSTFYPPGGAWLWSGATGNVEWGGPYCYLVEQQPDVPPAFTTCPAANIVGSHCDLLTTTVEGSDPDATPGGVSYSLISGPGSLTGGTWSWAAGLADVGSHTVVISISDANNPDADLCTFDVVVTNDGATFDAGCGAALKVGKGNTIAHAVTATSNDCDPISYTISAAGLLGADAISIDAATGAISFTSDATNCGHTVTATVGATDGVATDYCDFTIEVLCTEPFGIQIEKTHMSYQGSHELVDVFQSQGSEIMGGFDFLLAYDASVLSFQTAVEGDLYANCGWEYFTYRYGANGNCNGGCPSGLIRIVGIAETNNGPNHPVADCGLTPNETLFTLDFLVSDNRTYECQYAPVRFFWLDCGDNTISNQGGDTLWISSTVAEFEGGDITNTMYGYPTYFGAQSDCDAGGGPGKPVPVRFVYFTNGGIDIACADSIDARGDLNLNGVSNEIADAVLYSNYFVYGIGVFDVNFQGQVAASDVNADGIPLSVGDLVYLIRVVVGDALPYPKIAPVTANVSVNNGAITVSDEMGAAYVVIEGNATPELLVNNMDVKYAYDATENVTRVLVYSMEQGHTFAGTFLNADGNVLSIEMATYEGAPVVAKILPANFSLDQNYPNPFNPTTTIGFALPIATDYDLVIYNVTGQEVATFSGQAEAGTVEIEWNASNMASGIYFYKLNAGDFSETKKMVLVK